MRLDKSLSWRTQSTSSLDFHGKQAIVVGGTGGIGRGFARLLSARGAHVTVVGQTFRDAGQVGISFVKADLASMREAQRIARELPAETTDLLIFTTGIIAHRKRETTREGIERDMAISYLSRYVMLRELAPRLGRESQGVRSTPRVFIMGHSGHGAAGDPDNLNGESNYKAIAQHYNTVAANEALTLFAARNNPHIGVFGLDPGLVKSNIRDNFFDGNLFGSVMETLIGWIGPTADEYAKRIAPVFLAPEVETHSGALFNRKWAAMLPSLQLTEERVANFMVASARLASKAGVSAEKH